jgi:hypothetical protein
MSVDFTLGDPKWFSCKHIRIGPHAYVQQGIGLGASRVVAHRLRFPGLSGEAGIRESDMR